MRYKITKMQGGRRVCTDLHVMCIAQAHSLSSYFNLPLAWPSSHSQWLKLQTQDTLTTLEQCE